MITSILLILAGFVLLISGADVLVKGSVAVANKLKIPSLIVGLTIVALGTSAPEFVVSLTSAFQGAQGLVLGNVMGSNIANILLILGGTAIIFPVAINRKSFFRDFSFLMIVTVVFIIFALVGVFTLWMGIIMLAMLAGFIFFNYRSAKNSEQTKDDESKSPWANKSWLFVTIATIIGLLAIIYGADLLVDGAVAIAQAFGVSEEIIGLTIIAFGTSLPELATSCVAAFRKQSDLAIGNIVGSNIWNILFIMGATSTITNIKVPSQFICYDMWVMLLAVLLLFIVVYKNNKVTRIAGIWFVITYLVYLLSQILISRGGF